MIASSPLGMSERQSPRSIVVLPSHHGWEREANSRWDEETGREEVRKRKCLLGSARKWPFEAQGKRHLPQPQETGLLRSADPPCTSSYPGGSISPSEPRRVRAQPSHPPGICGE
jgi:hypothetical protein